MPSQQDLHPPKSEEELAQEILHRFISIPEQTYEQFLASFSHAPAAERKEQASQSESFQAALWGSREERNNMADGAGTEAAKLDTSDDQIVMDNGIKVGSTFSNDLMHHHKVQIDNYVDPVDFELDMDGIDGISRNIELFPGEAEVTRYFPSFSRNTCLEFKMSGESQQNPTIHQTDEVQPFALEEGFDYDQVALTPKFSDTELEFLKRSRNQQITLDGAIEQTGNHIS
ncbi:Hypothetical predicted protein [Pelobates cultripes]|uniref:Uncharacterized protein n=1 Tax=Pelobates cultripes TaxID=61616 RepID=A0AAD1TGP7_PELCU|nr:Hypothetical predicted protein [Pelobates cultripes]